ncbi:MAG: glycosyltransferase family 2 protein [Ruminococcaceae bacterium]|nr:glycosyltransferase family 2 protein [Oscillospiraceae bacterium]
MQRISVISPLYRGQPYLQQLIGVVERNVARLQASGVEAAVELILVNDLPGDELTLPEGDYDFPVRLLHHEENRGIHGARVTGLLQAQGDYILFLDQDDVVTDDFLCRQLQGIGDGDVVVANAWLEQADGSRVLRYPNEFTLKKVTNLRAYTKSYNQIVSPGQCLIRKAAIPEEWTQFITRQNGSDDLLLWVILLSRGAKFALCREALYTHKYTGVNLSAEVSKMNRSSLEIAEYLAKIPGVSEKTVADLCRSRTMDQQWSEVGTAGKLRLMARNPDLFLCRTYWKLRSKL